MTMWIIRAAFLFVAGSMGYHVARSMSTNVFTGVIAGIVLAAVLITIEAFSRRRRATDISFIVLGLMLGFIFARLVYEAVLFAGGPELYRAFGEKMGTVVKTDPVTGRTFPVDKRVPRISRERLEDAIKITLICLFCYIGVALVYRARDDIAAMIRNIRGDQALRPFVLDTNVVIDGRIAEVCELGLIDAPLIVPRFVLQEIKKIADLPERGRRERGRRGLDVLHRLQTSERVRIDIQDAGDITDGDVDARLVRFAKERDARVLTNDTNLHKIASLDGVTVLNIRELAHALRPTVMRGQAMHIALEKPGEGEKQAVGFEDDGAMVVVENGREHIGEEVEVVVTNILDSVTGRIIFARLAQKDET